MVAPHVYPAKSDPTYQPIRKLRKIGIPGEIYKKIHRCRHLSRGGCILIAWGSVVAKAK